MVMGLQEGLTASAEQMRCWYLETTRCHRTPAPALNDQPPLGGQKEGEGCE